MRCNRFQALWVAGLLLLSTSFLFAQQSAVYRDAYASYKRGMEFYSHSLYGKALYELEKAMAPQVALFDRDNTQAIFVQEAELYAAMSALRLEHPDAERRLLDFIQKNEPSSLASQAKLEVGRFYYAKRDYDKAIDFLSKINWSDLSGLDNEEVTEAKFQLAYCYFVKKKFNRAEPLFRQTKGVKTEYYYPSNYYFGLCNFFQKRYDKALDAFKIAEASKRYDDVVPTYITQIYFMQKQYDEVISYGKKYVNNDRIREKHLITQALGQAYYEKGDYENALPYIEEYVEKNRKVTEDIFYQLAYTQYRAARYEDAIANFEQINGLENKLGQNALYNQAASQLKLGRKEEARLNFELASRMKYDADLQLDALMNYAKLSYELGLDNDAITAFMKIPLGSKYGNEAQNLMSQLFLNTRDYDKALDILRKMPSKTPALKETYQKVAYFRGVQYYKSGNLPKSLELFNESLQNPIHTETTALCKYWKAEALFKKDQYDVSINQYLNFIEDADRADRLPANSSIGTAQYGIGYNYLRKDDYVNAAAAFTKSIKYIEGKLRQINDKYVTNYVYPDALVRAGDCYLYLGGATNYNRAGDYYRKIIRNNFPNKDYAMYQLSLIYSLTNQPSKQIRVIDQLVKEFPQSPFADDALYAKGSTQININEFGEAKKTFDYQIIKYPNSEFNSRALYKLGVISYSKDRHREALDYFKQVVKNNVQSEEAKSALTFIRKIYVEDGDPDGFMAYVSTLQGYNFSDMAADSLLYESAERTFDEENWAKAADNYSKYLDRFPKGLNSMSAHLNRGISYYNLKEYGKAIVDFEYLSDAENPPAPRPMAERANLLGGQVAYHVNQDFETAYKFFSRLEPLASTPENRFEALQFAMRSAYYMGNLKPVPDLAIKFLKEPSATSEHMAEAYFYLAKAQLKNKQYEKAKDNFESSIKLVNDDIRASEGRYQVANILYIQRKLDESLELAFQNNKELGQHLDWLARNFILIADIYAEKGNLDAAKGTLESLLNNYNDDPEIIKEAQTKLANIKKAIDSNSRLKRNNDSGELEMIED